jgi:hypothetical protein
MGGGTRGDTHGLLEESFIHSLKSLVTSSLHSSSPLVQAVLMALISLYLPRGTRSEHTGSRLSRDLTPATAPDRDPVQQLGPLSPLASCLAVSLLSIQNSPETHRPQPQVQQQEAT